MGGSVERVGGWEGLEGSLGRVVMNGKGREKTVLEGSGESWGVGIGGLVSTETGSNVQPRRRVSRPRHGCSRQADLISSHVLIAIFRTAHHQKLSSLPLLGPCRSSAP